MTSKYLLKIGTKLKIVPQKQLTQLSPTELMLIGVSCIEEQRNQLMQDALTGDKIYHGRKVVDALELSLSKLEEFVPGLRKQAQQLAFGNVSVN